MVLLARRISGFKCTVRTSSGAIAVCVYIRFALSFIIFIELQSGLTFEGEPELYIVTFKSF